MKALPNKITPDSTWLPRLIFVCGASRSGTTFLSRILGNNPCVYRLQELHFFGELCQIEEINQPKTQAELNLLAARLIARQKYTVLNGTPRDCDFSAAEALVGQLKDDQNTPLRLFSAWLRSLGADLEGTIFCEHTPRNIFYGETLLAIFPEAWLVHIIRDPRSVLASQKKRWRLVYYDKAIPRREGVRVFFNYHPLTMSLLWKRAVLAGKKLSGHSRYILVSYERLLSEPVKEVRAVCQKTGLEFSKDMLQVPRLGSSHGANFENEASSPAWEDVLSTGEAALCQIVNSSLMKEYGYLPKRIPALAYLASMVNLLSYPLHLLMVMLLNPYRAIAMFRAIIR